MAATHAKIIAGWGGVAKRGRAGFVLGKHGMSTWPLPRPNALLFGESPSGIVGNPVDSWTDALAAVAFTGSGANRPAAGTLNGIACPVFTGATPDFLTIGSNPFAAATQGEVWIVARSTNWERVSTGVILLSLSTTPGGPEVNYRIYGSTPPYGAARRMAYNANNTSGGISEFSGYGDTVLADNTTYVFRWWSDGSLVRMSVNGTLQTITTDGGTNTGQWMSRAPSANVIHLGNYLALTDYAHDGEIGFVMILSGGTLSTVGAAQWTRLLMNAYGA